MITPPFDSRQWCLQKNLRYHWSPKFTCRALFEISLSPNFFFSAGSHASLKTIQFGNWECNGQSVLTLNLPNFPLHRQYFVKFNFITLRRINGYSHPWQWIERFIARRHDALCVIRLYSLVLWCCAVGYSFSLSYGTNMLGATLHIVFDHCRSGASLCKTNLDFRIKSQLHGLLIYRLILKVKRQHVQQFCSRCLDHKCLYFIFS